MLPDGEILQGREIEDAVEHERARGRDSVRVSRTVATCQRIGARRGSSGVTLSTRRADRSPSRVLTDERG